jgi:quinoprotein glucose dehydrogenase
MPGSKKIRVALLVVPVLFAVLLSFLFWPALSHLRLGSPRTAARTSVEGRAISPGVQWPTHTGASGAGQYSPLALITRENVSQLVPAWVHHYDPSHSLTSETASLFEATPIIANGSLYFCTPASTVVALDPASGAQRWSASLDQISTSSPSRQICRGVAYWQAKPPSESACAKRIFAGDARGRLYSLDAENGTPCADFGSRGIVDLNSRDYGGEGLVYLTSPPILHDDLVIVGSALDDNERADAPNGIVRALDARTGREVWAFDPIPAALSRATGAANAWSGFSLDPANRIVYVATSSPSPDSFGGARASGVPYANAVVALQADTGSVLWSYQIVRHDLFDYDLPTPPILFELERGGTSVPALAQVTKHGFVFLLNRLTGEPLFAVEDRPAPASDVPGERSARTQPVPGTFDAFAAQRITRAEIFGLTWIDRAGCRRTFDRLRHDGLFTPPSERGSLIFPSPAGGASWGSAALDPLRQRLIVRTENAGMIVRLIRSASEEDRNATASATSRPMWGTPYRQENLPFESRLGIPCVPPPWGQLVALDLTTGRVEWKTPLGQMKKGALTLPERWGSPGTGGPMITAGGVLFVGASTDASLRAFDSDTGELLWKTSLPAPATAVPMSYEIDRRQFIVVAAGGNPFTGTTLSDALVAFALPSAAGRADH